MREDLIFLQIICKIEKLSFFADYKNRKTRRIAIYIQDLRKIMKKRTALALAYPFGRRTQRTQRKEGFRELLRKS